MTENESPGLEVKSQDERHPRSEAEIAPELRIVEWQNEWIVRSTLPFSYQAPDDMLTELRHRYELDDVVASGENRIRADVVAARVG